MTRKKSNRRKTTSSRKRSTRKTAARKAAPRKRAGATRNASAKRAARKAPTAKKRVVRKSRSTKRRQAEAPIFALLRTDHRTVAELFEQMTAKSGEASPVTALFPQLQRELELHSTAEEEALYPRLGEREATQEIASHSVEEHAEVRRLLEELAGMAGVDEKFEADLLELKKSVEHHVREEETRMFDLMREAFSTAELAELARAFQDVKDRLMGQAMAA